MERHSCLDHEVIYLAIKVDKFFKEVIEERKKIKTLEEELALKIREYDNAREAFQKKMLNDISQFFFVFFNER